MRLPQLFTTILFMLGMAAPAYALCGYKGVENAKTTIHEEYRDSKWVVKARLVSADDHWSDEGPSWTIYHVRTLNSFKGEAPLRLDVFTYRDSGGFYLDKGAVNDLGGEYLLFLSAATQLLPRAARGALEVNYSCGQSGPWSQLTGGQRSQLNVASMAQ